MSLRPTGLIVDDNGGVYVVIDDGPDYGGVLLIPGSFNHRRVARRDELAALGEYHPAAPSSLPVREERWRVVDASSEEIRGGDCETEQEARIVADEWNARARRRGAPGWLMRAPFKVQHQQVYETDWVDVPAPREGDADA